jgi:hypothetical protein
LAYKCGKLTGPYQSRVQKWALSYFQFSEKREQADNLFEIKQLLHHILRGTNDKLYAVAYPSVEVDDADVIPGHTYGVDDLEDMERLITKLGVLGQKTQVQSVPSEWSEWG